MLPRLEARFALAWVLCVCLVHSVVGADIPRPLPADSDFDALIARIRSAAATKEWQKPGWKDDALEAHLGKVIATIKTTTGKEFVKLPVELKDVSVVGVAAPGALAGGRLHVAQGSVEAAFANKSIFLVDGSIRISHASDCVVIARGAVEISHGNRNVILAGQHVNVGFDGSEGMRAARGAIGDPEMTAGSIILTPGSLSIAHAYGTICSAPQLIKISHANQVSFLASPKVEMSHQQGCKEHKDFKCPISFAQPASLPAGVFEVKQVVAPDDRTKQLVTVERNGREYVLRPGSAMVDESGKPIPGWEKWTVGFVTDDLVLFTDGQTDIAVRAR